MEKKRNNVLPNVMMLFGALMFVVYTAMGIFVITYGNVLLPKISHTGRIAAGALIVFYALFRLYRVIKLYKNREELEV